METTAFLLSEPKAVAAGVRRFRERHQLSQAALARLCGVSLRALQYLEAQSVQPSSLTIMKLDDSMRRIERAHNQKKASV
jgi:transcriptional regulator with XRE-family HTH domain